MSDPTPVSFSDHGRGRLAPRQIRRAIRSMIRRWERDEEQPHAFFGEYDRGESTPFSETQRNLQTAIAEAQAILGASDFYIAERAAA